MILQNYISVKHVYTKHIYTKQFYTYYTQHFFRYILYTKHILL